MSDIHSMSSTYSTDRGLIGELGDGSHAQN